MSREILFRGYTGRNWQYGYLIDKEAIRNFDKNGLPISTYRVIKETIGQFTGLTDNNGTKIFEGDIVKVYSDCDGYYAKKQYLNGVILFDEVYFFEYEISFNHIRNCCEENIGNHRDNIEVIGNIYDNPELLKED